MVSVAIRFLSALLGSLAAFYLTAHGMGYLKLISPHSLGRVDEFYTLLVQPILNLDGSTRKTMLLAAIALVAQGGAVALLFRMWDRPPIAMSAKPMAVEYADDEVPERLLTTWEKAEMQAEKLEPTNSGPSRHAIEAAMRLATRRA